MPLSIDALLTQHQRLMATIGEIERLDPTKDAAAISRQLGVTKQLLLAHLDAEDKELYPALRQAGARPDAPISLQTNINMFFDEMEGIKPVVMGFLAQWSEGAIGADPAGFTKAFAGLVVALKGRIAREEARLYPLYTQHCATTV